MNLTHLTSSYPKLLDYLNGARQREKGRPLRQSVRVFLRGSDLHLEHWGTPLAIIHPDNTISVVFEGYPPQVTHGIIPIYTENIGVGRYRVDHEKNVPRGAYGWPDRVHMTKVAPEYFPGIKFNLGTGACMNRKPDHSERLNHNQSLLWKKAVAKYREGIRVRARLGVFNPLIEEMANGTPYHEYRRGITKVLGEAIRDEDYSQEVLKALTAQLVYRLGPFHVKDLISRGDLTEAFARMYQSLIDTHRTPLREAFGVYDS